MNKKDYLEKVKKLAKITRIFCRIGIIASAVGVALVAITVIVAYAAPPEHLKPLQANDKLSIFLTGALYVPANVFTSVDALRDFLSGLLARLAAGIAIFIAAALHLMGLLKSVENGMPFDTMNVTRLRKIGVILIVGSVIVPAVSSISVAMTMHGSLLDVKGDSMLDATLLLCGALVLILSGIFAYGARLQREHDQTV